MYTEEGTWYITEETVAINLKNENTVDTLYIYAHKYKEMPFINIFTVTAM